MNLISVNHDHQNSPLEKVFQNSSKTAACTGITGLTITISSIVLLSLTWSSFPQGASQQWDSDDEEEYEQLDKEFADLVGEPGVDFDLDQLDQEFDEVRRR